MEQALYLDDCFGNITESSTLSSQSLATEPRGEEPSRAVEDARVVAAEARQGGDETEVAAERSRSDESDPRGETTEPSMTQGLATEPPVEEVFQSIRVGVIGTDQEGDVTVKSDGKPTDVTTEPSTTAAPIVATEPKIDAPSAAELAKIIDRILSEAIEPGDETYILEHSIEIESKQRVDASDATMSPTEVGTAEPGSEKLDNRKGIALDGDKGKDTSIAAIGGAEETWSADSSTGSAGKLTDVVEQSRPAQMVTNEPTSLNPFEE